MVTRFIAYLSGLLEAIWLGMMIVIPVFFNIYSSRIFEPDKTVILRSFALIGLGILVIQQSIAFWMKGDKEHPQLSHKEKLKSFITRPMIVPILGIGVSYLVATLFSVTPQTSFWGSYQRLQGFYTIISYLVIFFCVYIGLRKRAQVEKLIQIAVIASIPISLYGIIQRYGLDTIPWAGNVIDRVAGTMGNSVFLAAFLIMVLPLTLIRILFGLRNLRTNHGLNRKSLAEVTLFSLIAATQVMAIYFSGSRGPWLGAAASLVVLFLGISFFGRNRLILISGTVLSIIILVFVVVLNIPGGPLESLRSVPRIGRLGQLFDLESRTGTVRTLIWDGASRLFLPHEPLEFPDGSLDRFNSIRPLVGYGPESMFVAYNRFYNPGLTEVEKRNASPDRSHNEIWDLLIFTGILGLFFYLFLYGSIGYYSLKWMGFIAGQKDKIKLFVLIIAGGVTGSVVLILGQGLSFIGIGLPAGLLVGFFSYLFIKAITTVLPNEFESNLYQRLLLLGLLAGLIAHFVELVFGFGITSTRLYFWIYLPVLIVIGSVMRVYQFADDFQEVRQFENQIFINAESGNLADLHKPNFKNTSRKKKSRSRKKPDGLILSFSETLRTYSPGLLTAVLLCTLVFNFPELRDAFAGLLDFGQSINGTKNLTLLALFLLTWIIPLILLTIGNEILDKDDTIQRSDILINFLIPIFISTIYLFLLNRCLTGLASNTPSTVSLVIQQVRGYEAVFISFFVLILFLLIVLGFNLMPKISPPGQPLSWILLVSAPFLVIGIILGTIFMNLRVIQADISYKSASSFSNPESLPVVEQILDRAISLAPEEDYYYLFLVKAYFDQANLVVDPDEQDLLLRKAEKDMLKARAINPLNTDHTANLARLYTYWTGFLEDPEEKRQKAQQALEFYETAVSLSPNNTRLLGEMALLYLNQLGEPEKSKDILEQALSIDPDYDWLNGIKGEVLFHIAERLPENTNDRQLTYQDSLQAYLKSYSLTNPVDQQSLYRTSLSIARLYTRVGIMDEAIRFYELALDYSPSSPDVWRVYEILANLKLQQGDSQAAQNYARLGWETAPEDQKDRMNKLLESISIEP